ncbi:Tetratricopeptide repeat protein OS=Streptomyces rochei OX=1928 GN=G3I25_21105 PE=4 SV=1 [Streptomyces rochei]|nr:membrane protein [Streptomyces geysiriensis]GGZ80848.1 membrane protein [Streptomyces plicatus]GHC31241.1 membrane protein [Streptomyces vinaceusdrappus]
MKHSVKHSATRQTRRGRGPAHRIGRSLALVLPVVLVLSGTLAVTRVNWSGDPADSVLAASEASSAKASSAKAAKRAPHEVLRDRLLTELQEEDPGVALTHLQQAVNERPSLAGHCASIARALGRAAVKVYGPTRAQSYARPVCDTAFASGVLAAHS